MSDQTALTRAADSVRGALLAGVLHRSFHDLPFKPSFCMVPELNPTNEQMPLGKARKKHVFP